MFPEKSDLVIQFAHGGLRFEDEFVRRETGIRHFQTWDKENALSRLGEAHVLVTSGWWDNTWLDHAPNLRFVQCCAAGYNWFDLNLMAGRGVRLANATGVNANCVADHAMALILAHYRKLPEHMGNSLKRHWRPMRSRLNEREDELAGKTMGVYGYGTIGRALAKRAKAFDLNVIGVKRSPGGDPAPADKVAAAADFMNILPELDILALTCPLTDETRDLVNEAVLGALKPGAFFVNVARGGCMDEAALISALSSGHLSGAGVDVATPEPYPADGALWDAPNLIVTPHAAGDTRVYEVNVIDILLDNLERLWRGGTTLHNQIV